MLDFLRKALTFSRSESVQPSLRSEPGGLKPMGEVPRYPPFTEGIPAARADQLIETQSKLIRLIRHELALTEQEVDQLLMPLLHSFASFVHLLPASQNHHHRGAGGLFRHSLEVCMWATRISHSRIISGRETGERRKVMEPRWRMAIAVAALCHDIGKAAYDVIVTDPMGKHEWDIYHSNLVDWLEERQLSRYFLRWRGKREHKAHEKFSSLVTMRVIPPDVLSYLNEGDPEIISKMIETISGMTPAGPARVMHELVMEADQLSVTQDLKGQKIAQSDQALGVPVAKYLVDAMKRLIEDGHWKANTPGGALWVTDNGVFLRWAKASADIAQLLNADGVSGIPKSRDNMAESLWDFDVVLVQYAEDGSETLVTSVAVETEENKNDPNAFEAVEINGVETLFSGPHPAPVKSYVGSVAIQAYSEQLQAQRDDQQKKQQKGKDKQLQRMAEKGKSMPVVPGADAVSQDDVPPDREPLGALGPDEDALADQSTQGEPEYDTDPQDNESTPQDPPAADPDEARQPDPEPAQPQKPEPEPEVIAPASDLLRQAALEAQEFLRGIGDAGDVLREGFVPGEGAPALIDGDKVIVPFPSGMSHFGEQRNEALETIRDWIEPNPSVSSKLVQKRSVDGVRQNVVVVSVEASKHLIALYQAERETLPDHKSAQQTQRDQRSSSATKKTSTPPTHKDKGKQSEEKDKSSATKAPAKNKGDKGGKTKQKSDPKGDAQEKPKRAPKQAPPKPPAGLSPRSVRKTVIEKLPGAISSGTVKTMADQDGVEWVHFESLARWYQDNCDPRCYQSVFEAAFYSWKEAQTGYPNADAPDDMYVQINQTREFA